jgi:hypothetical protein
MKKQAGLWIDHRKAVIVIVSEAGEEIQEVTSNMEKHVRFSDGNSSEESSHHLYIPYYNLFYKNTIETKFYMNNHPNHYFQL